MIVSAIVATDLNNAIGKDNQLPWNIPADLKFFKKITIGHPVIMGRKTFESVNKPLPGRLNIVITSNKDWTAESVLTANSLEEALEKATAAHYKEIFIIGGGEIYRQSMAIANRIYLTRVHTEIDGDTFFPELNANEWKMVNATACIADEKNAFDHTIEVWEKI